MGLPGSLIVCDYVVSNQLTSEKLKMLPTPNCLHNYVNLTAKYTVGRCVSYRLMVCR